MNKGFQRVSVIVNNFLNFEDLNKPFEPILNKN